jgi:hypothetical protein
MHMWGLIVITAFQAAFFLNLTQGPRAVAILSPSGYIELFLQEVYFINSAVDLAA